MIPLKLWNVRDPIFVKGVPHTYAEESLTAAIDPKTHTMIVKKKQPGPGDPNVPVRVPLANVTCYTTMEDHERCAEELEAIAKMKGEEAAPSA
jgi:hypothetical protein